MIEVKVPKDIRTYKTKVIGPFTVRQGVCLVIMAIVDYLFYKFLFQNLGLELDYFIYFGVFIDVPIAIFGWLEPYDMKMEQYLKKVILRSFLAPVKRKSSNKIYECSYETETLSKKEEKLFKKRANKDPKLRGYE